MFVTVSGIGLSRGTAIDGTDQTDEQREPLVVGHLCFGLARPRVDGGIVGWLERRGRWSLGGRCRCSVTRTVGRGGTLDALGQDHREQDSQKGRRTRDAKRAAYDSRRASNVVTEAEPVGQVDLAKHTALAAFRQRPTAGSTVDGVSSRRVRG